MPKKSATRRKLGRTLDARPDTLDFRDRMFVPTLCEVPAELTLADYERRLRGKALIMDQGEEGACSGFGLAACCNYLLRAREKYPDKSPVSPRMLYEIAKRYDEWRGEDYDGSSARGAMKGWHKHGVCAAQLWPYDANKPGDMTLERARDAALRPLGAYFRVNHKDLVAMHTALSEVGIVYVTCAVHQGWGKVGKNGRVPYSSPMLGAHAFAIVGYDTRGFWFQNSWGDDWGHRGFGHLSYADWLDHGMDVWVARLGAPVIIVDEAPSTGVKAGGLMTSRLSFPDLRPHIVSIGNDGRLREAGTYGNSSDDVRRMLLEDFPKLTAGWKKRRVLLYAHGGLVAEDNAIQRIENYLPALLAAEVYPLAFIWKTDFWTTLKNLLSDALSRRRPEGALDAAKDFMLDRLDDTLEPVARLAGGKQLWGEMKENALLASLAIDGGARQVVEHLRTLTAEYSNIELHLAGHSAGSIFMAPIARLLTAQGTLPAGALEDETTTEAPIKGLGLNVKTCTLWAAACTIGLFERAYLPAIKAGSINRFTLFNLKDAPECDDHCAHIYNKSLLYLVSNAFEKKLRPILAKDGWPILGMDKFVTQHAELQKLIRDKKIEYVLAPNEAPEGTIDASKAQHHGDFDDDGPTVRATLARILGRNSTAARFQFAASAAAMRARRHAIT